MISLRPYQRAIVSDVADLRRADSRAILVVAPTGSGKTAIFAHIAHLGVRKGKRVLILVHRDRIRRQTIRALYNMGVVAGQIAAGHPMTADSIQVGMVQTVFNRLSLIRRPDFIISDEAHHGTAPTWMRTFNYWDEVVRLGFTATPELLSGRGLRPVWTEMVEGPQSIDLVREGWLAVPMQYRPPNEIEVDYHLTNGDFDRGEQEDTYNIKTSKGRQIVGDVIEHYRKYLDGLPTICFCISVAHCYLMRDQFRAAGYTAEVVEGEQHPDLNDKALQGLADGSVSIVLSCDLIDEGVDVPGVIGIIQLRRTMSLAKNLQQLGRGLRPIWPEGFDPNIATAAERKAAMADAGKPRAIILDHAGNYHIHGHVLAPRVWSLDALSRRERKERAPTTTTCPRCYGVWPGIPRRCPACGYEWKDAAAKPEKPLRVIAGELVEAGLPESEAGAVADVYSRAMNMDPKARAKALLGFAFRAADKRSVAELARLAGYNPRWSDWAWEYRQKRRGA